MTTDERFITILICVFATQLTRALPFLAFRSGRSVPAYVRYLGRVLPPAVFGMLVVYCLKDVSFTAAGCYGLAEILALAATVGLHVWKRNTLLSIASGTAVYMLLYHFLPAIL